jgi:upstream activation factor subunit UAF30
MKALTLSPALQAVVGAAALPRTEIVSKLWVYIKKNNLQDKVNKRMINADAKLKEVFGKAQVSMFEMAGLIGKHAK